MSLSSKGHMERVVLEDSLGRKNDKLYKRVKEFFHFGDVRIPLFKVSFIPDCHEIVWMKTARTVLLICKLYDSAIHKYFVKIALWLAKVKGLEVIVERKFIRQIPQDLLKEDNLVSYLRVVEIGKSDIEAQVHLIITLGGDGTLLHASSLFQKCSPPAISFSLGSFGFLTPFNFNDFMTKIEEALQGKTKLLLRSRLEGKICSRDTCYRLLPCEKKNLTLHSNCKCVTVLNEVVVERGISSHLTNLEIYINGTFMTKVQGDGLIIATPTGSTAYACSAGASMVHPSIPSIILAPICPHTLSFRPIVVPGGVEINLKLAPESRGSAFVSFDGNNRTELKISDCISITTSKFSLPTFCNSGQIEDWFFGLTNALNWNLRSNQGPLYINNNDCDETNKRNNNTSINANDSAFL